MEIQTGLEGLEQQAQKDNSQIDSFLQDLENKDLIINVINNTEDFNDEFKNFLNNATPIEKIKLKKQLKECKENEENIKLVLIEHIYKETGYDIKDDITTNTILDNNISTNIKQQTITDDQQANSDEQQAITDEQQAITDNQQAITDDQQANSDEQQAITNEQQAITNEQQAITNEQQAITNEQQAITKDQQANEIVQQANEKLKKTEALKDALLARQELVKDLPELDKKTNKKSELFQATKSELEQNGVIQQLKDSKHDETFINDYILVHTTLKELKQNENYKDVNISFLEKAVKNLDNACNIPDTKFDNFSSKNITQTRTELFDTDIGNHSLKEAKKTNKESAIHQKTYNEIFALDENKNRDTELIEKYGKFIEDDNIKDLVKKYENNELSEQDNDTLRKGLENIKENIDNQTKDLIEEMCLIAPVQGIFACIGPDLGNKFKLNKSREISNENGEVTITGHIDGIPFSLHHDTTDPDARLQTSSALTKIDNNKFEIGERFEDSPYKLPTNGDIFAIATSCITDEDVTNTKDGPTYFQTLQNNICKKFDTILYKNAKHANHYIKDKIKGEKISNQYLNLLGEIKESPIKGDIEQSNSKLYNFIDLIDFCSYISTISEKEDISHCIDSIKDVISQYGKLNKQSNRYPTIIRHFLMDKTILENTQKILNGYDIPGESIFDLFGYYTEQNSGIKTINFKQLKKDLEGKEGQESLVASMRQEDKTKKNADIDLDNAIGNIA